MWSSLRLLFLSEDDGTVAVEKDAVFAVPLYGAGKHLALGVFPETLTGPSVEKWVAAHEKDYDFNTTGWPAWYPTRSLEEWEKARKLWEPYVFRGPDEKVPRPNITAPKKKNKKAHKPKKKVAQ